MGSLYAASPLLASLQSVFGTTSLWAALIAIFLFILLGYALTRMRVFPAQTGSILNKVVLYLALPALAFTSFMEEVSPSTFQGALFAFVFGFVVYPLFILLGKALFLWVKEPSKRLVLALMFAFGTTTFFAQPLISATFGNEAFNDSNMFNIAYRVYMYPYAFALVSGAGFHPEDQASLKRNLKAIFLNAPILCTLIGFLLWSLQLLPGAQSAGWWTLQSDWLTTASSGIYVPFWRIDVSLPWLFIPLKTLASLSSPLAYLAIGSSLASSSLRLAAKDGLAWAYGALKNLVGPAVLLGLLFLIQAVGKAAGNPGLISMAAVEGTAFMWVAPPSVVVSVYCLEYDKEKELVSHLNLVGSLSSLAAVPLWVLILSLVSTMGFFA